MERHERGCWRNPNRVCGMHPFATGDAEHPPIGDLAEAAWHGLERLRDVAGNCPACINAGISQLSLLCDRPETMEQLGQFDFRREREEMWRRRAELQADEETYA